jgi:tetratricopeptide (TPR) repeat protein
MDPALDWGNPETPSRLLAVVLRRDFWGRRWIEGPADLVPISLDYVGGLGRETLWLGLALAVAGFVAGRRRGWPVLLPVLGMAANLAAMAAHGSRSDIFVWHRYYIPSYLLASILVALGCQALLERLRGAVRLLTLALPLVALVIGHREFDRSRYRIADDFSRTLLATLPPGAHLTASDDNILFVLIYLHHAEAVRPDLDLILEGVGSADLPPLRFDPDRDPLFLTHHPNWRVQGLEVVPVGLVFQTVRAGRPLPVPRIPKWRLEGEDDPRVPKDYLTQNLVGHFHYMLGISHEERAWPLAQREFQAAMRASPGNDVLFYNLGLIYRRNGLLPEALAAFEASDRLNPRAIASLSRARASDRVAELREEVRAIERLEQELLAVMDSRPTPGTLAYHAALSEALSRAGRATAARGHALRAELLRAAEGK